MGESSAAPQDTRWIDETVLSGSVTDAAIETIGVRLFTVARLLPLAAHHADESIEHVHQLRVSTRRTLAALKLYREVLPAKDASWLIRQMKRIRKAAGQARDLDVMIQRHTAQSGRKHKTLVRELRSRRKRAQIPMVQLCEELKHGKRLMRRGKRMLKRCADGDSIQMRHWARKRMSREVDRFWKLAPSPRKIQDSRSLHRFRVGAKSLRYTIELLATAFPDRLRTKVYPVICRTQDALGEINDHDVASRRIEAMSRKANRRKDARRLQKLADREVNEMDDCRCDFRHWWTPEFVDRLDRSIAETLKK